MKLGNERIGAITRMLAAGHSIRDIAVKLHVSRTTVANIADGKYAKTPAFESKPPYTYNPLALPIRCAKCKCKAQPAELDCTKCSVCAVEDFKPPGERNG